MTIEHNNKIYELVELCEIGAKSSYDIIAIFKIDTQKEDWELGELVNYFYGADDAQENIIAIAKWYIDEYEKDTKTQPQNDNAKRYARIKKIISVLSGVCGECGDVDPLEDLLCLLPFKDDEEKDKWVDLTTSFKFWEDWEEKTLEIANRLIK